MTVQANINDLEESVVRSKVFTGDAVVNQR
jgi:hypothetical protein